jgi:hypothetical protein
MEAMVRESPNNPEILAKAAQITLMHIDHSGFDKIRFDEAEEFIARIQKVEPQSRHIRVLHLLSDRVRKKYKQDAIPQMGEIAKSPEPKPTAPAPLPNAPKIDDDDFLSSIIL